MKLSFLAVTLATLTFGETDIEDNNSHNVFHDCGTDEMLAADLQKDPLKLRIDAIEYAFKQNPNYNGHLEMQQLLLVNPLPTPFNPFTTTILQKKSIGYFHG
eukprot:193006_1